MGRSACKCPLGPLTPRSSRHHHLPSGRLHQPWRRTGRNPMTYDPRRLRLHELIECIPFTRRYCVTGHGLRTVLCYHRTYARVLRPAMSVVFEVPSRPASRLKPCRRLVRP